MVIDPTTNIGKLRLRVGDFGDLPLMPDNVYQSALDECSTNLPRATILVARYILGLLTAQTHQRLAQIEVYGNEWYANYKDFIKTTILNPHFMQLVPIPYSSETKDLHPLLKFRDDWNLNYTGGTQSEQMAITAQGGFTNGATFGF